ncbi:peptidoglycan editing factor PgeF [Hoeflea prorocentri]|uniref:Purine nucleoside phosphorylase n=1 Tax=Hoeflea prorocentri TaxID=1922333 RepID=A0A9X3UFA7_9HYPH|nr:peptidoglycan editing factor PgeF [Hoeflea prorocentri]MCY6379554.1 peptidoglycan editing factor PgeF [Hoeflea prorocentri]MDA5397354.1 peptidoglycan editing factor PgeF [Hoeflea prorocentri]
MLDREQPEPITSHLLETSGAGPAIRHGFFTRYGGVSEGIYRGLNVGLGSDDNSTHVAENRKRVSNWFGLSADRLATTHQIHSAQPFVVDGSYDGERPKADAIVTATPGIAVGVLTADCGPVLLSDPQNGVVAAAHAGWKGALDGIVENTILAMEQLGARRDHMRACVGPCISGSKYEVGPEFVDRFRQRDNGFSAYFSPSGRDGHSLFDLQKFVLDRIALSGVEAHLSGHCTYSDENRFFSYRRTTHRSEPDYGRQISAIGIVDGGQIGSAL